jgi:pyrroline-5-carboxylate reductase
MSAALGAIGVMMGGSIRDQAERIQQHPRPITEHVMPIDYEIGFLGAGNMAEAIASAAIQQTIVPASAMLAADPAPQRREVFAQLGVEAVPNNQSVVERCRCIVLAVKPQTLPQVAEALQTVDAEQRVLVSIMAGVRIERIEAAVGKPCRVVRVMPNTPMLVNLGMSGVALGPNARPGDEELPMRLFGAAGEAVLVSEAALDAITAVSGSGPAYLFYLAEAMEQAAIELGLGDASKMLVQQTLLGAATLLRKSPDSAAELRAKVSSPGGTTQAALTSMEEQGVRQRVVEGIKAAHRRSLELGGM